MNGDNLQGNDNVVRYASPSKVINGKVDGTAFRLRNGESDLSVNWLEYFKSLSKTQQLAEVCQVVQLQLSPRGLFAELNVGITQESANQDRIDLRFVHRPKDAVGQMPADPSHAQIEIDTMAESFNSALFTDILAKTVQAHYLPVAPPT